MRKEPKPIDWKKVKDVGLSIVFHIALIAFPIVSIYYFGRTWFWLAAFFSVMTGIKYGNLNWHAGKKAGKAEQFGKMEYVFRFPPGVYDVRVGQLIYTGDTRQEVLNCLLLKNQQSGYIERVAFVDTASIPIDVQEIIVHPNGLCEGVLSDGSRTILSNALRLS